ncbi:hypothetical protein LCGC14_2618440, partial [marine sediment metagenome]
CYILRLKEKQQLGEKMTEEMKSVVGILAILAGIIWLIKHNWFNRML